MAKRIIGRITYNTATATVLYVADGVKLYRTRGGHQFFYDGEEIWQATSEEISKWMKECLIDPSIEPEQTVPNAIRIRVPDTLRARVGEAAKAENMSMNEWVIRVLEMALRQKEEVSHEAGTRLRRPPLHEQGERLSHSR